MAETRSDLVRITLSVIFIGGLMAFGLVGIFVGPVVLAVAYTLLDDWISDEQGAASRVDRSPAGGARPGGES